MGRGASTRSGFIAWPPRRSVELGRRTGDHGAAAKPGPKLKFRSQGRPPPGKSPYLRRRPDDACKPMDGGDAGPMGTRCGDRHRLRETVLTVVARPGSRSLRLAGDPLPVGVRERRGRARRPSAGPRRTRRQPPRRSQIAARPWPPRPSSPDARASAVGCIRQGEVNPCRRRATSGGRRRRGGWSAGRLSQRWPVGRA